MIAIFGFKFHRDHFICSLKNCSSKISLDTCYLDAKKKDILCSFHNSILIAEKCAGCNTIVMDDYVETVVKEIKRKWHSTCHNLHKAFKVTLSIEEDDSLDLDGKCFLILEIIEHQEKVSFQVKRMMTSFSNFGKQMQNCVQDVCDDFFSVIPKEQFFKLLFSLLSSIEEIDIILIERSKGTISKSTNYLNLLDQVLMINFIDFLFV
jgi:hypothetical protein